MSSYPCRTFPFSLPLVILCVATGLIAQACAPVHWSYQGEHGPEAWGTLSDDFSTCSEGMAQSPIDLVETAGPIAGSLELDYRPSEGTLRNNGHTIQYEGAEGDLRFGQRRYRLVQFHLHHPSEHAIAGARSDLEIHFVHRDDEGNLVVVGLMVREGQEAGAWLGVLLDSLPGAVGSERALALDPAGLLPEERSFYTYEGSLTTPPCSEGVRWFVLREPIIARPEQIAQFRRIYAGNARPLQPLGDREVRSGAS